MDKYIIGQNQYIL